MTFSKKSTFTFLLSFFWFVRLDDLGGRLEFREVAVLPEKLHLAAIIVMAGEFKVNFGPRLKGRCLNGLCWRKISSNSLARLKVHWLMLWLVCIYYTAPSTTKTWSRRPRNWGLHFLIGFTKILLFLTYSVLPVCSTCFITKKFQKGTFWHEIAKLVTLKQWDAASNLFFPLMDLPKPMPISLPLLCIFERKNAWIDCSFLLLLFSVKSQKGIRQKINYFLSRSCISACWRKLKKKGATTTIFLEKRSHLPLSF